MVSAFLSRFVLRNLQVLVALIFGLAATAPAMAQSSVVIWPVDPRIGQTEQATALWLENRGTAPVTLQVRSFAWGQVKGEDDYGEQDAVVASPPIARIAPGERQLVRVIRRAPDQAAESAYRLLIDELPQPSAPGDAQPSAHLAVQMRYSIPLFTYGADAATAKPSLTARIERAQGKRWLVVANDGAGHARLTDLRVRKDNGLTMIKGGLVGYVLPHAAMRWPLPDDLADQPIFTVTVNGADQSLGYSS